jgi:hypothetical protein
MIRLYERNASPTRMKMKHEGEGNSVFTNHRPDDDRSSRQEEDSIIAEEWKHTARTSSPAT